MDNADREALQSLDDDEFMERWTEAAQRLEDAKADCRAFSEENTRRDAVKRIDSMSDAELDALAQYTQTRGIESKEDVTNG